MNQIAMTVLHQREVPATGSSRFVWLRNSGERIDLEPNLPAVEAKLNERQKRILAHVLESGSVTSGWCLKEFGVVYNTAYRDLAALVRLGLLKQEGSGRGTRYTLQAPSP